MVATPKEIRERKPFHLGEGEADPRKLIDRRQSDKVNSIELDMLESSVEVARAKAERDQQIAHLLKNLNTILEAFAAEAVREIAKAIENNRNKK